MEYSSRMRCANKVAAVTGSTAGIGLATVKKMVEEGGEVYMLVRNLEKAKPIVEELNAKGPGRIADVIWFDGSEILTIEPAVRAVYEKAGRIDIFVNNANGFKIDQKDNLTIADTSHEVMMKLLEGTVGVYGEALRVAIPLMIEGGGGSIVNVSSTTSIQADTTRSYYGIGKAAVNLLTETVALQYGRQGIRCNAVLPAFTLAEKTLAALPKGFSESWVKHAPIRRLGTPDDQANAIMFFATDDSAWVTGQLLSVSGGFGVGSPCFCDVYGG